MWNYYLMSVGAFWGVMFAVRKRHGGFNKKNLPWTILASLIPVINIVLAILMFLFL